MESYRSVCDRNLMPMPPVLQKNRPEFIKYLPGDKQTIKVRSFKSKPKKIDRESEGAMLGGQRGKIIVI